MYVINQLNGLEKIEELLYLNIYSNDPNSKRILNWHSCGNNRPLFKLYTHTKYVFF